MYERQACAASEIERELPHAGPADGQ